jgi:hypothetical protein
MSINAGHDMHFVGAVLERWRGATSNRDNITSSASGGGSFSNQPDSFPERRSFDSPMRTDSPVRSMDSPMLQPSLGLDPDRFSLLKKPLR